MTSFLPLACLMLTLAKAQTVPTDDPLLAPLPPIDPDTLVINDIDGSDFTPSPIISQTECAQRCIQDLPSLSGGKVNADQVRNIELAFLFTEDDVGKVLCDGKTQEGFVNCLKSNSCNGADSLQELIKINCNPPPPANPTTPEEDAKIQEQVAKSVQGKTDDELNNGLKNQTSNDNNSNSKNQGTSTRSMGWMLVTGISFAFLF